MATRHYCHHVTAHITDDHVIAAVYRLRYIIEETESALLSDWTARRQSAKAGPTHMHGAERSVIKAYRLGITRAVA